MLVLQANLTRKIYLFGWLKYDILIIQCRGLTFQDYPVNNCIKMDNEPNVTSSTAIHLLDTLKQLQQHSDLVQHGWQCTVCQQADNTDDVVGCVESCQWQHSHCRSHEGCWLQSVAAGTTDSHQLPCPYHSHDDHWTSSLQRKFSDKSYRVKRHFQTSKEMTMVAYYK